MLRSSGRQIGRNLVRVFPPDRMDLWEQGKATVYVVTEKGKAEFKELGIEL